MGTEPTFTSDALTDEQRDGLACVVCGADTAPMRPVGHVDGVQVFACTSHVGDEKGVATADTPTDEKGARFVSTPADDDATSGKSATWPDGEPASVRQAADEQDGHLASLAEWIVKSIDQNADLSHKFADEGETDLASAFADVSLAWREVVAALGSDMGPAVAQVDAANVRARAALAAARARTSSDMGDAS